MIRGARAGWFSPLVHGVDDAGALCKVRPRGGRWLPVKRFPVNCPRCLYVMGSPRYAVCETPTGSTSMLHIRKVGLEGVTSQAAPGAKALCGAIVGWDRPGEDLKSAGICAACKRTLARANAV